MCVYVSPYGVWCQVYQVRKEQKNVKRTILKSVVGTLDLSVRYLLIGETFPGVCHILLGLNASKCNNVYRLLMVLMLFQMNNFCRKGRRHLLFAASTEHHQADMAILQTYALPNRLVARVLQATCCILLLNLQNLLVILI